MENQININENHGEIRIEKGDNYLKLTSENKLTPDFILINKQIRPSEDLSQYEMYYDKSDFDLIKTLEEHQNIVILGNAGSGKSNELKSFHDSLLNDGYFPFFIDLKLYKDDLSKVDFPKGTDTSKAICLFDGLDETDDIGQMIEAINGFKSNHQEAKIIVSCRTNIYANSFSFEKFYVQKLTQNAINNYLLARLKNENAVNEFNAKISQKGLYSLYRIPFFLIRLCDYYLEDNRQDLPNNKRELFEQLIDDVLKRRLADYSNLKERKAIRKKAKFYLKKLAFVMECSGLNQISTDVFHEHIVNDEEIELLLKKSSLIDGNATFLTFSHRNFQEFFASQVLAEIKKIDTLLEIILVPNTKDIKLTWLNTIGFFWSNLDEKSKLRKQLYQWLISNNPITFTQFEKDFIREDEVFSILKAILKFQKKKGLYFSGEQADIHNLATFCTSLESQEFLVSELKRAKNGFYQFNIFSVIRHIPYKNRLHLSVKNELKTFLIDAIFDDKNDDGFISDCIEFLGVNYDDIDIKTIVKIVNKHFLSENEYIRWKTIEFIGLTNTQHLFMEDLFKQLLKVKKHGNENRAITKILDNLNTEKGIVRYFEVAANFFEDIRYSTEMILFSKMLINAEQQLKSITTINTVYEILEQLFINDFYYINKIGTDVFVNYLTFFNKKITFVEEALKHIEIEKWSTFLPITKIIDDEIIDFLVQKTNNQEINYLELEKLQRNIYDDSIRIRFNEKINQIQSINLPLPIFEEISKQQEYPYIEREIFFNKDKFIDAINHFFDNFGKDEVKDGEIFLYKEKKDLNYDDNNHSFYICHHIRNYVADTDESVSKKKIIEEIHIYWEQISIDLIREYFENEQSDTYLPIKNEIVFTTFELDYLEKWCNWYLSEIKNEPKHRNQYILCLAFCIKNCSFFHFDKKVYKILTINGFLTYEIIFENDIVEYNVLINWIDEGLKIKKQPYEELEFIADKQIVEVKETLEYLLQTKIEDAKTENTKFFTLKAYLSLGDVNENLIFNLIQQLDIDKHTFDLAINTLMKNVNYHQDLETILKLKLEDNQHIIYKFSIAKYLVELGNNQGLKYIINHIKSEQNTTYDLYNLKYEPKKIKNLNVLNYALELLELSLDKDSYDGNHEIAVNGNYIIKTVAMFNNGEFYYQVIDKLKQQIKIHRKSKKPLKDELLFSLRWIKNEIKETYSRQHTIKITEAIKTFNKIQKTT